MSPRAQQPITHGLIIQKEPLDKILARRKTWEMRGSSTTRRGAIALIESGTGCVVGTCELVDVVGPLTLAELRRNAAKAGFRASGLYYERTHAWVIRNARRLPKPIPYRHRRGVVIWVRLTSGVSRALAVLMARSASEEAHSHLEGAAGVRPHLPRARQPAGDPHGA